MNCPVCDQGDVSRETHPDDREFFSCQRCGDYFLLSGAGTKIPDNVETRTRLSYGIHRMQRDDNSPEIDTVLIDRLMGQPLPTLRDQTNNLILWVGDNVVPGEPEWVKAETHQSVVGATTPRGFGFVLEYLMDQGLLKGIQAASLNAPLTAEVELSFDGWQYYEELKRGAISSRKAFMAMKFGDEVLDGIVDEVFRPAVCATGFKLHKLDDAPKAGLIDDRLRVEIQLSRFLIADLTHDNLGAYWEAGYAEGLGKPVIYTCEKKRFEEKKTHFDTNHHLTVRWGEEDPAAAGEELKATIRATLPAEAKLADD